MLCNKCAVPMNHLNTGDGFSGTDAYETWDHLECPKCKALALEYYRAEFVPNIETVPNFALSERPISEYAGTIANLSLPD